MSDRPKFIIMDKHESVLTSIVKDVVTFAFLLLCVWVSQGSTWWTFFTGSLFIAFGYFRMAAFVAERQTKLYSKAEAVKWANALPDDAT